MHSHEPFENMNIHEMAVYYIIAIISLTRDTNLIHMEHDYKDHLNYATITTTLR